MKNLLTISSVAAAFALILAPSAQADGTWTATSNGTWIAPGNWSGGTVPGATSGTTDTETATFNSSTGVTVTVDTGRNIQNISFDAGAGAFTLSGGSLLLTSLGEIQITSGITSASKTETITSPLTLEGNYTFANNSTIASNILKITGAITSGAASGTTTLSLFAATGTSNSIGTGVISDGANSNIAVSTSGAGTWTVSANNTYSGGTTINAGKVVIGASGGTTGSLGSGAISIASGANLTYARQDAGGYTVANTISGAGSVTKSGTGGVLMLTGNNTYSGGTTVQTSTLLVNNSSGSGTGSGSIAVGSSGATLGGSGTVNPTGTNKLTFLSGGIIAPGTPNNTNSLTISAAGNTFGSGMVNFTNATLAFNLGSSNTSSALNLTNSFSKEVTNLSGNTFNFTDLTSGTLALGEYTLIQSDDSTSNPFNNLNVGNLSGFTLTGLSGYAGDTLQLQLNQLAGTGDYAIQLDITAAPEPSTWALMLGGLTTLVFVMRKRQSRVG